VGESTGAGARSGEAGGVCGPAGAGRCGGPAGAGGGVVCGCAGAAMARATGGCVRLGAGAWSARIAWQRPAGGNRSRHHHRAFPERGKERRQGSGPAGIAQDNERIKHAFVEILHCVSGKGYRRATGTSTLRTELPVDGPAERWRGAGSAAGVIWQWSVLPRYVPETANRCTTVIAARTDRGWSPLENFDRLWAARRRRPAGRRAAGWYAGWSDGEPGTPVALPAGGRGRRPAGGPSTGSALVIVWRMANVPG
jgi:hypothetical protein